MGSCQRLLLPGTQHAWMTNLSHDSSPPPAMTGVHWLSVVHRLLLCGIGAGCFEQSHSSWQASAAAVADIFICMAITVASCQMVLSVCPDGRLSQLAIVDMVGSSSLTIQRSQGRTHYAAVPLPDVSKAVQQVHIFRFGHTVSCGSSS